MKRQHFIVMGAFGGGLILLVWLGWFFVAKPLGAKIDVLEATRADKEHKLEDARNKAAQYEKFQAQAENYKRDLNFINRRVDADFSLAEEVRIFSALANTGGLGSFNFEFKERTALKDGKLPNMDTVPVTIKFTSGYHEAAEFVSEAITQSRIVVPVSLLMKGDDSTGEVKSEIGMEVIMEAKAKAGGK